MEGKRPQHNSETCSVNTILVRFVSEPLPPDAPEWTRPRPKRPNDPTAPPAADPPPAE
ncbi:MAG: hypothetical protein U0746_08820 [Gemmataceae bacterium]